MLQCIAVCCSVVQGDAVWCCYVAVDGDQVVCCSVLQCVVALCVAVWCSVLQCGVGMWQWMYIRGKRAMSFTENVPFVHTTNKLVTSRTENTVFMHVTNKGVASRIATATFDERMGHITNE